MILPLGRSLEEVEREYLGRFETEAGASRNTGPRTRSRSTQFSFGDWLFAQNEDMGALELREDGDEEPFETKRWFINDAIYETEDEDDFSPEMKPVFPAFGQEILLDEQLSILKAWECWAENLGVKKEALRLIDIAVTCITVVLARMGRDLRVDQLVPHVKTIVDCFTDKLPIIINPRGYRSVQCRTNSPVLVKMMYSEPLREGIHMVKEAKEWLRMRTRRTMLENLNDLGKILSRVPVEVSDILKKNVAECLDEVKKLIYVRYACENIFSIEEFPRVAHVFRDMGSDTYMNFIITKQRPGGDERTPMTRRDLDFLKEKFESTVLERRLTAFQLKRYFLEAARLMTNNNLSEGNNLRQETFLQGAVVEMIREERAANGEESESGHDSEGDNQNSGDWNEYTLPSQHDSEPEMPTLENLMEPE